MSVYLVTITFVSIFSLLYDYLNDENVNKIYNNAPRQLLANIFFGTILLILVLVAGLREFVGTDYWTYASNYSDYAYSVWDSIKSFNEPGIRIIAYLSSRTVDHYGTMMLIASAITIGLSLYTIKSNSKMLYFSILLYILIGSWHGSFNGVRQYLACAILFAGHSYIIDKKFLKYSLIVLVASLFHLSAIPLIALYFLPQKKLKIQQVFGLLVIALIGLYSYTFIFEIIADILAFRGSSFTINSYVNREINPYRILISMAPIGLYFLLSDRKQFNARDYFYVNMLFINAAIFIFSFNSAYLARYAIYTNIYTVLALPSILKGQEKDTKWFLVLIILILYFYFWYYEVSNTSNLVNFQWIFH